MVHPKFWEPAQVKTFKTPYAEDRRVERASPELGRPGLAVVWPGVDQDSGALYGSFSATMALGRVVPVVA